MKTWISSWKRSIQPRKQRKYRYEAPKAVQGKFLSAHLSKTLREKYKRRSLRVRKGDKVKILRGQYKGQEGKVELINLRESYIYITKIEVDKRDGSKAKVPLHASNLVIMELDTTDKRRMGKISGTKPAKE